MPVARIPAGRGKYVLRELPGPIERKMLLAVLKETRHPGKSMLGASPEVGVSTFRIVVESGREVFLTIAYEIFILTDRTAICR